MLITQLADQRRRLEEDIYRSVEATVQPILDQLKAEKLPESAKLLFQALEFNLKSIFSPVGRCDTTSAGQLTPREMRLCELIRSGLSSKEIAEIMGIAPTTVVTHRTNIRKKLGLTRSQDNLATYLKSQFREH